MRVLDLFAGAGGLSLGLAEAGLDVRHAVEWDADSAATYRLAHPDVKLFEGDIATVDFTQHRGEIDVIAGGPPCQPWSDGGRRLGHDDPRDGLPQYLRAVREINPQAFVLENVGGLARAGRLAHLEAYLQRLRGLGYHVVSAVLAAADFGVPQRRRRLFVVGTRRPGFDWPVGGARVAAGRVLRVDRVIGETNPAIVTYARAPDLRPSPYDGHVYNGGGRPINLADLAPTMLASMGGNKTPWIDTQGVVPEYHAYLLAGGTPRAGLVPGARRITVAEAALLQTFPAGMRFCGRRSSQYKQVGNAVPPRLAAAVGTALREFLS